MRSFAWRGGMAAIASGLALALAGCSLGSFGGGAGPTGWSPESNAPPVPAAKPLPPTAPVTTVALETSGAPVSAVSAELPPAQAGPAVRYIVQAGDSLYGLSRRFGTPIQAVIVANDMAPPYRLATGQQLVIPRPLVHVVQPGDTAYGVSRRYGVDLTEMVRLNDIAPPYTLVPGQQLAMPGAGFRGPAAVATAGARAPDLSGSQAMAAAPPSRPAVAAASPVPAEQSPQARQQAALTPPTTAIPQPPPRQGGQFLWPLEGQLVARFGSRDDGVHNDGINIAAPRGTPVRAAENGVVAYAGEELKGFGRLLLIKHDGGWVTAYAHNDSLLVRRGDTVRRGQVIARVGSSGSVSRPQLHFEVRKGTRAVDPLTMLVPSATAAR